LRGCVPERIESDRGHRKNQGYDGQEVGVGTGHVREYIE
jgi:hypothetical protein